MQSFHLTVIAKCRKTSNTFKLWLSDNEQLNHLNQRQNSSKESEADENQDGSDGSILSQDITSEVIDYFYVPHSPAFESRTTNPHSDNDLLGSEGQSEDSCEESSTKIVATVDTEAMPTFELDQGQSTNPKEE